MDWAEKYRPHSLKDIVGNRSAVKEIWEWAKDWTTEKKPLLLYGKPGVGKTSAAYALANDRGWGVIELNASDQRTKAAIEKVAGSGSMNATLTGAKTFSIATRKLIILDEADNIHGTADRGGARAMADIIRASRQPIMLIANDKTGVSKELRAACTEVLFKALPARSIVPHLREICISEDVRCSEDALVSIAESSNGDVRAAINMLYASAAGSERLEIDDIHTSQKDERATIFDLIRKLFGGRESDGRLMQISRGVDDAPDAVIQWIEQNLDNIRETQSVAAGYRALSVSDIFLGRTFRRQYYTLWRYATAIMVIGAAKAAENSSIKMISPPKRWRKMGTSRRQKELRIGLINKLSGILSIPDAELREGYLSMLSLFVESDPHSYVREWDLDSEELTFFLSDRKRAAEVIREVEKERKELMKEEEQREKERLKNVKNTKTGDKGADDPPAETRENDPAPEARRNSSSQMTLF